MENKTKKIFALLVILWLALMAISIYRRNFRLFTLDYLYKTGEVNTLGTRDLLKGAIYSQKFVSHYDNLFSIEILIHTFFRENQDKIEFRIKEEGGDWFYKEIIDASKLKNDKFLRLDFPTIENSKNRYYYYEFESLTADNSKNIRIDYTDYVLTVRHKYSGLFFPIDKLISIFRNKNVVIDSFVYGIPFFLFIVFGLLDYSRVTISLLVGLLFLDILFLPKISDFFIVVVCTYWMILLSKNLIDENITLYLVCLLLVLLPILFLINPVMAEKTGVWIYALVIYYPIHILFNRKFKWSPTIYAKTYLSSTYHDLTKYLKLSYLLLTRSLSDVVKEVGIRSYKQINLSYLLLTKSLPETIGKMGINSYERIRRIMIVRLIMRIVVFGSLLIFGAYLANQIISRISEFYRFYLSFFPDHQIQIFINQIGIYLTIVDLLILAFFTALTLAFWKSHKIMLLLTTYIFFVLILYTNNFIFNSKTETFRDKVIIWSITPSDTVEQWVDITLGGRNFGDNPNGSHIRVAGEDQRIIRWQPTEIIFRTNPFTTEKGDVEVVIDDKKLTSNSLFLNYNPRK